MDSFWVAERQRLRAQQQREEDKAKMAAAEVANKAAVLWAEQRRIANNGAALDMRQIVISTFGPEAETVPMGWPALWDDDVVVHDFNI